MTVSVLFVCMGNICRSPTAHAVFRDKIRSALLEEEIKIDSAGTHGYHVGSRADARAIQTALVRGVDMTDLRARKVLEEDFYKFDHVVAMDFENLELLTISCPKSKQDRLSLMLDWTEGWGREVPDPYYGGETGFKRVFDMVASASEGLLDYLCQKHKIGDPHL